MRTDPAHAPARPPASAGAPLSDADRAVVTPPPPDMLVGMVGHELRNLMSPLLARAQAAMTRPDDQARLERAAEQAAWTARRAVDIGDALVELAQTGRVAGDECCDLGQATGEIVQSLGEVLTLRRQRVVVEGLSETTVAAGSTLVRCVLANLVLNALQASPEGGVVRVRSWQEPACSTWNTGVGVVGVVDSGEGMPPAVCRRLNEPVLWEELSFKREPGSKAGGLGLLICRWLVDCMGGRIRASADARDGTAVEVRLPMAAVEVGAKAA